MRVLVFHPALTPYRVDLFNLLADRVTLHVVFLQENAYAQHFDQQALLDKCKFSYEWCKSGPQIKGLYLRYGLRRLIDDFSPKIVISHEFLGVSLQIAWIRRSMQFKHLVWTASNPQIHQRQGIFKASLSRIILRGLDGVVTYTQEMGDVFRRKMNFSGLISNLPNIPHEREWRSSLLKSSANASALITRHSLEHKKVVLFVGRLAPEKRVDLLIKALGELKDARHSWVALIVGDGGERSELEALVEQFGLTNSVRLLGSLSGLELAATYRISTLFVLPSSYEPFGAVVNEALMSGMPVICSNFVGAKIWIREGQNGSVIDCNDSSLFAARILESIEAGATADNILRRPRPSLLPIDLEAVLSKLIRDFDEL